MSNPFSARDKTALEASLDAIRLDAVTVEFASRRGLRRTVLRAVNQVDLSLRQGETLALVGESGCGKSTLVRTIFGLNPIASGQVSVFGQDVATATPRQRRAMRRRVQMVFQDPFSSLNPGLSAHEIVAEPLRINKVYSRERVLELFEQVGLSEDSFGKKPGEFSGGQRQRTGIARALALDPEVLVLDEPVSALDVSVQAQVLNLLADLQERLGLSYLFIAHDLSVIRHIADRVAVMQRGSIVELGSRDQVFNEPTHGYTQTLLSSVPIPDPHQRPERVLATA